MRNRIPPTGCLALGLAACVGAGCSTTSPPPDPPPQPRATHRLTVTLHASTMLPTPQVDEILAEMGWVLRTRDGADDVACNVEFVRDGEVSILAAGTGIINTSQDYLAVNSAPGNIKVVNQINWCGGFAPNILGCTGLFGDSMIVVRYREDLEGILWLHEFGHAQGLEHRASSTAVMNATINPDLRRINASECQAFLWDATVSNPIHSQPSPSLP